MSKHPYDMKTPCAECPFRNDRKPYITPERYEELRDSDGEFHCHKTVDYDDDEDHEGENIVTKQSKICAGFLIINEHSEKPNQMMRICERIGIYDRRDLDMDSSVYDDWDQLIAEAEDV